VSYRKNPMVTVSGPSVQKRFVKEFERPGTRTRCTYVFDYIEMFYNPRRRHSFSNDLSPVEYEKHSSGLRVYRNWWLILPPYNRTQPVA